MKYFKPDSPGHLGAIYVSPSHFHSSPRQTTVWGNADVVLDQKTEASWFASKNLQGWVDHWHCSWSKMFSELFFEVGKLMRSPRGHVGYMFFGSLYKQLALGISTVGSHSAGLPITEAIRSLATL